MLKLIRNLAWVLVAVVLGAYLALHMGWFDRSEPAVAAQPAEIGGEFTLVDQNGRTRNWAEFRGKATAVFFGFTYCPEICPATLFELSERLRTMGPDGDLLNMVFITVDPERDTSDVLKRYLQSFDPRIVALTGSDEEIAETVAEFKAHRQRQPLEDGGYTMDHTTLVYLFDAEGMLRSTLDRHESAEVQEAKISRVIR